MPKTKYHVYRVGEGWGCYARNYRSDLVGKTYAESPAKAVNNVRWNLKKQGLYLENYQGDSLGLGGVQFRLQAVRADEDPHEQAERY